MHEQHELDDILPAWWYSIFYVYSAATVLVAARLQPPIIAEVSETAIMDGRHAVMRIFKKFARFDKHATRCAAAISVLFDQVPLRHSVNQQAPNSVPKFKGPGPFSSAHQSELHARCHGAGTMKLGNRPASSASLRDNAGEFLAGVSPNTGDTQRHNGPILSKTIPSMTAAEASAVAGSTPGQGWALSGSTVYQAIDNYDQSTADDYSSMMGIVYSAGINIDLGGMSWLASHPSQFYGNSML